MMKCALTYLLFALGPLLFAAKPNIVYILADDLGYGDLACYNPKAKVATPHMDRMAAEGMRFTDAHSPATVCTPSRYSILTGRTAGTLRSMGIPCLCNIRKSSGEK